MRFKTLFILLAILTPLSVISAEVRGRVTIKGSRNSAKQVTVVLLPEAQETTTDSQGRFQFETNREFPLKLVINQDGYDRFETELPSAESAQGLEIYLNRQEATDFETTIISSRTADPAKKELSIKKAASLPGAGAEPLRAVQNLPGVNRSQGFSAQVIIQGSAPQDTRYAIDQHEIPIIFHFGGLSSVLNPELTKSFDYLAAGYQAEYGRANGGIINLNTRKLDAEQLKGSVFLDTFNAGAFIETPVGKESRFSLGGRYSYIGTVLKAVLKDMDSASLTAAPTYADVSALYETPISDRAQFRLFAIGSSDQLELVVKETEGDSTVRNGLLNRIGFFRLIPSITWKHSSISESQFSIGMGRDFINTSIGDQFFNLKSTAMTVRMHHQRQMNPDWTAKVGIDHRYAWSDISLRLPQFFSAGGLANPISAGEERYLDLNSVKSHRIALYTHHSVRLRGSEFAERFTLMPGLRLDYFTANRGFHVSPKFGTRYSLSPSANLVLGSGYYVQPPQEQETSQFYGNPNLKSPASWHARLGYEKDLSAEWFRGSSLYSGVFARWFKNLVLPTANGFYNNDGSGRAFGWESQVQVQYEPWDFSAIYTLSRSTRSDPQRGEYLFNFDQTHLLTLIAGVNLPKNWRISARFRYVTGPLETVPLGGVADLDNDVYLPIRGALNTQRLAPFAMLDLRADKKWVYDKWTLTMYLDIINALNRSNPENTSYSYDYRTSQTTGGIPILPTFGLKGEF